MSSRLHDRWTSRFGLIMAMSGGAVGLGNFLRFPGKMEPFGGAFLIPYFTAFLLLGIPLMWIEWTIGRYGGGYGHGSTPGMFHRLWKHPVSKYLGVLGVVLPFLIGIYYVYIESWSLGFAIMTITGQYWGTDSIEGMSTVFTNYLGLGGDGSVSFGLFAYSMFLLTLVLNMIVFGRGVQKGIEIVAKFAMPTLLVLGVVLAIRVLTLPEVDGRSAMDGLRHFFRIDMSQLATSRIWIEATGQIFFTLSLGFGMIHTYASYLTKEDDLTANSLATAGVNEFVEMIIGAMIAVPAAVVFFGVAATSDIVAGGTFNIGFFALPMIFQELPAGQLFGTLWFVLLFLAALTSSVAMFTPLLLFLTEELRIPRPKALAFIGVVVFLLSQPVVLFMKFGVLDEIDFWAGTFFLVVFGAIEAVVFAWIFGMAKGWEEMHHGSLFRVPRIFFYIMKYVTPTFTIVLLGWWMYDNLIKEGAFNRMVLLEGMPEEKKPYVLLARAMVIGCGLALMGAVHYAWKHYYIPDEQDDTRDGHS